jgi:hypothetical protein
MPLSSKKLADGLRAGKHDACKKLMQSQPLARRKLFTF